MTTTDYSRKLCEICRIKPEIIEDYDGNEFEIYPDFTKPENFVKLLGLNVSARYRSLMHYITSIFCRLQLSIVHSKRKKCLFCVQMPFR